MPCVPPQVLLQERAPRALRVPRVEDLHDDVARVEDLVELAPDALRLALVEERVLEEFRTGGGRGGVARLLLLLLPVVVVVAKEGGSSGRRRRESSSKLVAAAVIATAISRAVRPPVT